MKCPAVEREVLLWGEIHTKQGRGAQRAGRDVLGGYEDARGGMRCGIKSTTLGEDTQRITMKWDEMLWVRREGIQWNLMRFSGWNEKDYNEVG